MYCSKCGNFIDDNAAVCPYCGTPKNAYAPNQGYTAAPNYSQVYQTPQPQQNNTSSASKTLGILSIVLGLFVPIAGVVLGIIGLVKACNTLKLDAYNQIAKTSRTLNIIGICVSVGSWILGIIASTLWLVTLYSGLLY